MTFVSPGNDYHHVCFLKNTYGVKKISGFSRHHELSMIKIIVLNARPNQLRSFIHKKILMLIQNLPFKIFRHVRKKFKGNKVLSAQQWKDADDNIFFEV